MSGGVQVLAAAFGTFLLATALGKVDAWFRWKRKLSRLIPLSGRLALGFRVAIPAVEAGVAALLFASPLLGLVGFAVLLSAFGTAALSLTLRHSGEDCGCFGTMARARIGLPLAARDFSLAAISLVAAMISRDVDVPRLTPPQISVAFLAGLLVVICLEWRSFRPLQLSLNRLEEPEL